jgi:MYXO-CTERM domain-containing protein
LAKRSTLSEDAAITFEYEAAAVGDANEDGSDVEEVREVTGDWDEIYVPTTLAGNRRQVLIRDLVPGEAVHVSFVALDRELTVIKELQFTSVPAGELDDGSAIDGAEDPAVTDDGSGCACASTDPSGTGGVALGLLGVLGMFGLGRRSRARRQPR